MGFLIPVLAAVVGVILIAFLVMIFHGGIGKGGGKRFKTTAAAGAVDLLPLDACHA